MCPFADQGESRCAGHWTLKNVFDAFRHCADNYRSCPVYRQMLGDLVSEAVHCEDREPLLAVAS